jgi:hypothetical protein
LTDSRPTNFYRLGYDGETPTAWCWGRVDGTFHEFERFRILRFGE